MKSLFIYAIGIYVNASMAALDIMVIIDYLLGPFRG